MKLLEQVVLILLFAAFAFAVLLMCADKAQKIDNGDIIVVSEDYMDR